MVVFVLWAWLQLVHAIVCVNRDSYLGYRLEYVHIQFIINAKSLKLQNYELLKLKLQMLHKKNLRQLILIKVEG